MTSVPPGSIVVGVDGSDHAERAVRWAAEQAWLEHRRLAVVAVDERSGAGWTATIAGTDPADPPHLRAARLIADDAAALARKAQPEIDVVAVPAAGDSGQVLAELSSRAHLLVVGSRGRGAIRSRLLGSVSTELVRTSVCPVVVCRAADDGPSHGVVVGADGTAASLPVIEFAFTQASLRDCQLTVVHCFWDTLAAVAGFREASETVLSEPHLEELRLLLAESVAGCREKYPDVPVTLLLRHGLVDEALTPRGRRWELIVVGRQRTADVRHAITGSITTAVVERAHCPVAVVPEALP